MNLNLSQLSYPSLSPAQWISGTDNPPLSVTRKLKRSCYIPPWKQINNNIIINIITLFISHKRSNSLAAIAKAHFAGGELGISGSSQPLLVVLCCSPELLVVSAQCQLLGLSPCWSCSHIPFASLGGGNGP